MHNARHIITASCIIANDKVYRNGELLFEGNSSGVSQLMNGLYEFLAPDYPKYYKMDNLSKLGWLATEILLKGTYEKAAYAADEVGVVFSNSNASLDTDLRYFQTVSGYPSPSLFVYTLPNIVIGEVCIRHKLQGENAFFVFEKFEPDFIHKYTRSILGAGVIKACICGWIEILANDYKAAVFLVEQKANGLAFTPGNMSELFTP
jgi:hypothetical protein